MEKSTMVKIKLDKNSIIYSLLTSCITVVRIENKKTSHHKMKCEVTKNHNLAIRYECFHTKKLQHNKNIYPNCMASAFKIINATSIGDCSSIAISSIIFLLNSIALSVGVTASEARFILVSTSSLACLIYFQ